MRGKARREPARRAASPALTKLLASRHLANMIKQNKVSVSVPNIFYGVLSGNWHRSWIRERHVGKFGKIGPLHFEIIGFQSNRTVKKTKEINIDKIMSFGMRCRAGY